MLVAVIIFFILNSNKKILSKRNNLILIFKNEKYLDKIFDWNYFI